MTEESPDGIRQDGLPVASNDRTQVGCRSWKTEPGIVHGEGVSFVGLFVSNEINAVPVTMGLDSAYRTEALTPPEAASRASSEAAGIAQATHGVKKYHFDRILVAFGLFFLLLAIAIVCDAKNWVDDPKVLYGMATTVLGIIVGFLGGEAGAGPSN